MAVTELARLALDLPPEERLELARRLVEYVGIPADLTEAMKEGVQRLDDLATGKVMELTEEQFRDSLK